MVQKKKSPSEKGPMAALIDVMGDPTAFTLLIYKMLTMQKDIERRLEEIEKRLERVEDQ